MYPRTLNSLNKKESEIREGLNAAVAQKTLLSKCNTSLKSMRKEGRFTPDFISSYVRLTFIAFMAFDMFVSLVFGNYAGRPKKTRSPFSVSKLKKWCLFLNKKMWDQFEVGFHIEGKSVYFTCSEIDDDLMKLISDQSIPGTVLKAASPFIAYSSELDNHIDRYSFSLQEFKKEYDNIICFLVEEKACEKNYKKAVKKLNTSDILVEIVQGFEGAFKDNLKKEVEVVPDILEECEMTINKLEASLKKILVEKEKRKKFEEEREVEKQKRIEDLKDKGNELISVLVELGVKPKVDEQQLANESVEGSLTRMVSALDSQLSKLKNKEKEIIKLRKRGEELLRKLNVHNVSKFDKQITTLLSYVPEGKDPKTMDKAILILVDKDLRSIAFKLNALLKSKRVLESQAEKSKELCKKYEGKFSIVSDCIGKLDDAFKKVNSDLNKKSLEDAENLLDALNTALSKINDVSRRWDAIKEKVSSLKKHRTVFSKQISSLNVPSKIKSLLSDKKFEEVDALFNYLFLLLEHSSKLKKKDIENYFQLLDNGKYQSLKKRLEKQISKEREVSEIDELKKKINRPTFSNEIILERMRALFWVLGDNDLNAGQREAGWLYDGHPWIRPTTHKTKHVFPALRDLGMDIESTSKTGEIRIVLARKDKKLLKKWLKLYNLILEKEN